MFDQILQLVKDHMNSNPQLAAAIPEEHADAIHNEIANHITSALQTQPSMMTGGGDGSILSTLEHSLASGNMATSAIAGGLMGSLAGRFGLSPAITGAIAAALPGIMQKFTNRPGPAV
jgi:hypothetical protein